MPQSAIAILSMMVASLFAYNQHRNALNLRMDMIRQDIALRTSNVAVDLMEEVGSMAFDDATKAGTISSASDLTFGRVFDQDGGEGPVTEAGGTDDLDDYDGTSLSRTRTRDGHTMTFSAITDVEYVTGAGYSTGGAASKMKRVTVSVVSTDISFADTIRISQVFSCGARCNW